MSKSVFTSIISIFGTKQPVHTSVLTKKTTTTKGVIATKEITTPKPHLQSLVRPSSRRPPNLPFRNFSSPITPVTAPKKETGKPSLDAKQQRRRMLAAHRRSRSIPLITLDYFGSTDNVLEKGDEADFQCHTLPVRKPLTFVIPPPPDHERSPRLAGTGSDTENLGSRLANLFSKGKERRPLLSLAPGYREAMSKLTPDKHRRLKSNIDKQCLVSRDDAEYRRARTPMRRISSAPGLNEESLSFYQALC